MNKWIIKYIIGILEYKRVINKCINLGLTEFRDKEIKKENMLLDGSIKFMKDLLNKEG